MNRQLSKERLAVFPGLQPGNYQVTSEESTRYNCIAFAAGRQDLPWWPIEATGVYWPDGVDKDETIECFIQAYQTEGYLVCEHDATLEIGFEKIAIYLGPSNEPIHAARQLSDGRWTSKLGDWEDIEHDTLEALQSGAFDNGFGYGKVGQIMKRPKKADADPQ